MCIAAIATSKAIDKSPVSNYLEKTYGFRTPGSKIGAAIQGKRDDNKFYQPGGRGYQPPVSNKSHSPAAHVRSIASFNQEK